MCEISNCVNDCMGTFFLFNGNYSYFCDFTNEKNANYL